MLAALFSSACAGTFTSLTKSSLLSASGNAFSVRYAPGLEGDVAASKRALLHAAPRLARWGGLHQEITVALVPTHRELEQAVNRRGYLWLRAWARYDDVLLQAPSTWTSSDADLAELLTHELTHCLMYQRAGTRDDWARKGIPLWFREGMAAWTAEQGYRWMSLDALAKVYDEGADPVARSEELYQSRSPAVYAAAHYAFSFLVRRYGEGRIGALLDAMGKGALFPEAFQRELGLPEAAFVAEFRRYVSWRGYKQRAKPVQPQPP
jgi:hypothetical protein